MKTNSIKLNTNIIQNIFKFYCLYVFCEILYLTPNNFDDHLTFHLVTSVFSIVLFLLCH